MEKVEYIIKPETTYIVIRSYSEKHENGSESGGGTTCGQYETIELAERAKALFEAAESKT